MLTNLDSCCDFVTDWFGVQPSFPGKRALAASLPPGIHNLHRRLGLLWESDAHPLMTPDDGFGRPPSLFSVQDRILDPAAYAPDTGGVIPFAVENQGVWCFGFHPDKPDALLVQGDWHQVDPAQSRDAWHSLNATIEDALTFVLLGNLCLFCASDADWQFDDTSPPGASPCSELLWNHPAWGFAGFWTDPRRTLLRYAEAFLTVKRPS